MRKIKTYCLGIVLLLCSVVNGQETFHNIYFFDDSVVVINDIYPTDSGYYFSAAEVSNTNLRVEALFGKLNLNGTVDFFTRNIDLSSNQFVSPGSMSADTNGHFTFTARNSSSLGNVPRVMKFSESGAEVMDTLYSDWWSTDSMLFYDFGSAITTNNDSSHYLYFTYHDEDFDSPSSNYGEGGVLLAKLNILGNIVWEKRFASSLPVPKPQFSVMSILAISDTTILLTMRETRQYAPSLEHLEWSKIHIYIVDTAGSELEHNWIQDTQLGYGRYGLLKTDNEIIYSHLDSDYAIVAPSTQPSWNYTSVITCLDENYQMKWKDTLINRNVIGSIYESSNKFVQSSDSSFVGAYTALEWYINEDTTVFWVLLPVELFNKDLETGEDIWKRHYRYFPEDSARRYIHEITDTERTPDGGYIMCGSVISYDSLEAGKPAQYGYVIKTNCLGFLGSPEVAVSYVFGEDNTVSFTNESIQAGSYYWDFGDGDTLLTGESATNIAYSYGATGIYNAMLIGYGCDGISDTLYFSIDFKYTDPAYAGDGTLLTLYPNPVLSGSSVSFYIGAIPEGENYLHVYNELGQRVDRFHIDEANTNYIAPVDYAGGVYHFVLESNSEVLETEKLLVQ